MNVFRVERLDCGICGSRQRIRVAIAEDGTETYPDCHSCGPTDWIAFPKIPVTDIEREEEWAGRRRLWDDLVYPDALVERARTLNQFGLPLCPEGSCQFCHLRRSLQ